MSFHITVYSTTQTLNFGLARYQVCEALCSGSSFFGTQFGQEVRSGDKLCSAQCVVCVCHRRCADDALYAVPAHDTVKSTEYEVAPRERLGVVVDGHHRRMLQASIRMLRVVL